jgi:hypothetical protein
MRDAENSHNMRFLGLLRSPQVPGAVVALQDPGQLAPSVAGKLYCEGEGLSNYRGRTEERYACLYIRNDVLLLHDESTRT